MKIPYIDVVLQIDAQPEDSGFYGCRLIKKATNYVYLDSQEHRIHVIGTAIKLLICSFIFHIIP